MKPRICAALVILFSAGLAAADDETADKARAVLTTHCHRCHGLDGVAKGGFGYLLDRERLVSLGKVVPGKPEASELYQRVAAGEMPPKSVARQPTAEEKETLRLWIKGGAAAVSPPRGPRAFLSEDSLLKQIQADLKTIDVRHQRFVRYVSFAHLHNAGLSDGDLDAARAALSKLVNSLSWHPRITVPSAIDPNRTVYRLDLRDYQWPARVWDRLQIVYPYRTNTESPEARAVLAATGSQWPFVRGDWFLATASRPPFYHDFLQLPASDRETERLIRVDVANNLQEETAIRAGFNGSGVSRNNRLIERHDAAHGAYWRSYDFSDNSDRQNIFDHPLGPQAGQNSFTHAGGEMIFNLPNGLQGYLLVDANGRRIDKAPVEIVSDPRRPDRTVTTGLSCMTCHVRGLIPKADQVRAHLQKNPGGFSSADAAAVRALYRPDALTSRRMQEDIDRFVNALKAAGVSADAPEPIAATVERFEATLDLAAAAGEVGLPRDEFEAKLRKSKAHARLLGPLVVKGGTVQRSAFELSFNEVLREFRPGSEYNPSATTSVRPAGISGGVVPFTGHTANVACIAISADGKRALSGGEDQSVRLWDVGTGRELLRLTGHKDEVLSVAFSPDGRLAASGGKDGTVIIWDLETGKSRLAFKAHTDRVTAVVFPPDGRTVLSGGWDKSLRLWDVGGGEELLALRGGEGKITALSVSPDGRTALSGGSDGLIHQWDLAAGREVRRLEGHTRDVFALRISADGSKALSGGADRTVRLWDLTSGKESRSFAGPETAVIGVAFDVDGKSVIGASGQYRSGGKPVRVWDIESGREVRTLGGSTDTVWSIAFSPDSRIALTASSDRSLRLWSLVREP